MEKEIKQIALSLKGIEESLRTLAEDTKAKKELDIEIMNKINEFESSLIDLKNDPFGLNKRD
ncbi:hypothetical protein ACWOAH_11215 [Vagococcus vulneris]|uniref:Uncharacterized protein n=1 Tax=Vagococcus vulneris TaxID=1977869 RepID=A0A429ZQR1_9ENTE|nr:hypothetical protein [Vagococcus vulneris]RST96026.1 hypothetical protein CBF37_11315 [Vagococcus vulneris]